MVTTAEVPIKVIAGNFLHLMTLILVEEVLVGHSLQLYLLTDRDLHKVLDKGSLHILAVLCFLEKLLVRLKKLVD